jgi:hypothetical protein
MRYAAVINLHQITERSSVLIMRLAEIISTLTLLALLFGACNHSSSPDNPPAYCQDISAYLPMDIGNIWNYRYDSGVERAIIQKRILDTLRHTDGSLLFAYNEDVKVNNPP